MASSARGGLLIFQTKLNDPENGTPHPGKLARLPTFFWLRGQHERGVRRLRQASSVPLLVLKQWCEHQWLALLEYKQWHASASSGTHPHRRTSLRRIALDFCACIAWNRF